MSLLREIQNSAIDSNTGIATLLRKCKVLSVRLGSIEFKSWIDQELSGYKTIEDLPEYRILNVNSKGNFSDVLGSSLNNADIPIICIPEKHRERMSHSYIMQPVASIEALVIKSDGGGTAEEPWDPNFVAMVGRKIYQGMNCLQAWKVIPMPALIAAIDEIRNRILNFVLEIESQNPNAGEAELNTAPLAQEKVSQIFNTYISGNVQNVATGSHKFEQHATNTDTNKELFDNLLTAIQSVQHEEILKSISATIEKMRSTQGTIGFKNHYTQFMSILADHMQILGPIVAPFLPALAAIVP